MQEKNIAPEVKVALARCFAAHQALRSYSADVVVTVRGIPNQKDGMVRIAMARPGRLRLEGAGPRGQSTANLVVAHAGFLYQATPKTKSYAVKRVPIEGDASLIGLEDSDLLPLPLLSQLLGGEEGLERCLAPFRTLTQQAGRRVFTSEGRFQQTMVFDETNGLLKEVRIIQGTDIEIREVYQNVRANPSLPSALWRFVPPVGYVDENAPAPRVKPENFSPPPRSLQDKKLL